ncbi:MAG: hypothetical protein F4053_17795 [Proteobacteria bacterium]|nr:hypothetical protein [Pseudomonadota bacterium]
MQNNKRNHDLAPVLLVSACVLTLSGPASAYETFHGPTELIYSDPEQAAPGYLLLPSWPRHEDYEYTYLLNFDGEVVHMWKTVPPEYEGRGFVLEKTARLTEKGTIVQGLSTAGHTTEGERLLLELDWTATSSGHSAIHGRATSTITTSSGSGTTTSTTGPSSSRRCFR